MLLIASVMGGVAGGSVMGDPLVKVAYSYRECVATCQAEESFHEKHLAVNKNILLAHVGIYMAAFRQT